MELAREPSTGRRSAFWTCSTRRSGWRATPQARRRTGATRRSGAGAQRVPAGRRLRCRLAESSFWAAPPRCFATARARATLGQIRETKPWSTRGTTAAARIERLIIMGRKQPHRLSGDRPSAAQKAVMPCRPSRSPARDSASNTPPSNASSDATRSRRFKPIVPDGAGRRPLPGEGVWETSPRVPPPRYPEWTGPHGHRETTSATEASG